VLELQRALHAARVRGEGQDVALLVEHDPVITLGRSAHAEHLLSSPGALREAGIEVFTVERGGDVTLHGPGQLVAYPIVDLGPDRRDVRRYVNDLIEAMRRTALDQGVVAGTVPGQVGLWVDRANPTGWAGADGAVALAKLGALGVRIARWVTFHGFALNVSIDLQLYGHIVPCGVRAYPVTSLAALTGRAPAVSEVARAAHGHLAARLGAEPSLVVDDSASPLDPASPPPWFTA
jgi:lipoyl(octanoyl) transferase